MTEQEIYKAAEQKVCEWATSHGFTIDYEDDKFKTREYVKRENGVEFRCVVFMNTYDELDLNTRIIMEANTVNEDIDAGALIKEEKDLEYIKDFFDRWEKLCISYLRTVL